MQSLRKKVDQIDQKILKLLQQRTELSTQIGETKRQHGVEVYAPARERALLHHLLNLNTSTLPARALVSIYREIISSSRAAQGQAPLGLWKSQASLLQLAARDFFGGSDNFTLFSSWPRMAQALEQKTITLGLLPDTTLWHLLGTTPHWNRRWQISGEIPLPNETAPQGHDTIFVVTPRRPSSPEEEVQQILILIECKSTENQVKSLLKHMPSLSFQSKILFREASCRRFPAGFTILKTTLSRPLQGKMGADEFTTAGAKAGLPLQILGAYLKTENYAG